MMTNPRINFRKPVHVGIIMDGNRRWAKNNTMPLIFGHQQGARKIEPIVEEAIQKGITHLTFWAFSKDNWKREKKEIEMLFTVFRMFLNSPYLEKLQKQKVKVSILGDVSLFPKDIQTKVMKIMEQSKYFTTITVNFGLNYGGRDEILYAVNKLLKEDRKYVDEKTFSEYLYTQSQPDPDLIIRTGGEKRLSGFLPWQSTYSELYFTDTLWPDFTKNEFDKACKDFSNRQRRFGK